MDSLLFFGQIKICTLNLNYYLPAINLGSSTLDRAHYIKDIDTDENIIKK